MLNVTTKGKTVKVHNPGPSRAAIVKFSPKPQAKANPKPKPKPAAKANPKPASKPMLKVQPKANPAPKPAATKAKPNPKPAMKKAANPSTKVVKLALQANPSIKGATDFFKRAATVAGGGIGARLAAQAILGAGYRVTGSDLFNHGAAMGVATAVASLTIVPIAGKLAGADADTLADAMLGGGVATVWAFVDYFNGRQYIDRAESAIRGFLTGAAAARLDTAQAAINSGATATEAVAQAMTIPAQLGAPDDGEADFVVVKDQFGNRAKLPLYA